MRYPLGGVSTNLVDVLKDTVTKMGKTLGHKSLFLETHFLSFFKVLSFTEDQLRDIGNRVSWSKR